MAVSRSLAAGATYSPLHPVYAFNEPGQPIRLYDGPIGGLAAVDVPGVVELSCIPKPEINWFVTPTEPTDVLQPAEVTLKLPRRQGDMQVPAVRRRIDQGWSNGAVYGRHDAPLQRIVAHWFNLPNWPCPMELEEITQDGRRQSWLGRWVIEANGWKITFDVRPDHRRVWNDLHKRHVYVMTHVMELRSMDGAVFSAADAEPVLTTLHVGMSFVLGRWAAPMLPVGLGAEGEVVWENWRVYHCDPARSMSAGWWYEQDQTSLAHFVECLINRITDPHRRDAMRLQMMLAIEAINDRGFTEQRVMMGAAGLEHLMWQTLVLGGQMTENQYKGKSEYRGRRLNTHDLLRKVLTDARIPIDIDPNLLPATASFVGAQKRRQGKALDAADVVTQIRNRLVHPKDAQDEVYGVEGLITETWLLTRHHLVLLILYSLGYQGLYRDLRKTAGWAGDVGQVPWALTA
jgi:hypothetical protein